MAIKPMPVPSADPYYNYNTTKKKKQTNSGYRANTVTPPPKPAQETSRTANSTVSAPQPSQIYEQPQPKEYSASKQSSSYLENVSSYNPLTLNQNKSEDTYGSIRQRTVTYDAVPTPQKQHGSVKPQQPKSYSYTEPKAKTNQYVNNTVNNVAAKADKVDTKSIYAVSAPKINIGEYKTLGGYTNTNPYVSKDRVADYGQNSYSAQSTPQEKKEYTGVKNQTAADELWNRYYTEVAGTNGIKQPQKPTKTTEPKQQNTNTVKAGKSTINIRDDGSTIHYDSDTSIDLFDFLDFLNGRYGPNNEMAESMKIAKEISEIPDLIAKAQPKNNLENPVLQYEDMIRKPDAIYGINADEWIANAPENWEDTYKDKWFYGLKGKIYEDKIVSHIDGLKTAEKEILLDNPVKSAYLFFNRDNLTGAKNMAT
ncbi:MAG: hypothetical protein J6B21_02860, partial [Oscillospiraceae bacterium]|nr:hypothetical protein [Oscillospiraceae bacterium]